MSLGIGTVLLSTLVLIIFSLFTWRKFQYWKIRGIPYKEPSVIFGNLSEVFNFKKSIGIVLKNIHLETTTPYTGIFYLNKPILLVKDRDLIKTILVKRFDKFSDRTFTGNEKADYLGSQTLFLLKNPRWGIIRKKMSPAYTSGKIKSMYSLIAEIGHDLVTFISKTIEGTGEISCKELFIKYGTEVITSTAFGVKANSFENEISEFRSVTDRLFNFNSLSRSFALTSYVVAPIFVGLFKLKFIDTESATFLRSVFWEIVKKREESNLFRNDLIQILLEMRKKDKLEENNDFDEETLLAQAIIFFIGGFETSSSTISFMLYELASNPEIQNNLRQEIDDALRNNETLNYDVLTNLQYLDMVFKETLRKYPILPYLDRKCSEDYKIPETSHLIEKGVGVFISVLGLHMDPENFPNPEEFIPERFSPENIKKIKPFSYLPFGEGPRNCIGARFAILTVKSAIANVIANFEVEPTEDCSVMDFHPKGFILSPKSGDFPLKLRKISHQ